MPKHKYYDERLYCKVSQWEKAQIKEQALKEGISISRYVRSLLLPEANQL